ncbi:MAG: hypothetical protein WAT93_03270 [Pontixanthobacter sp.]
MIAAWCSAAGLPPPKRAIMDALQAYGRRASYIALEDGAFFTFDTDQTGLVGGPAACPSVLYGWIDNPSDVAAQLGMTAASHSALYSAALDRWGMDADRRLSGNYAVISRMPDGSFRLARSAWDAPPLYYVSQGGWTAASPLLRVLFAAGAPKQLDHDAIIDQLAASSRFGSAQTAYRGIGKVSLGHTVYLRERISEASQWYDPSAIKPIRFKRDSDYAEAASELLGRAAQDTLAQTGKPALALSGGLDSPLVAAALLDHLATGRTLDTITFSPDPNWPVSLAPGTMGDEAPLVQKFAAMHPQITPHFSDPAQAGFTFKSREMTAAMQCFAPGLANVGMFHGVYAKARELGCDWLLTADLANQSFSNDGRWAYAEYARTGRWAELVKLLNNRPGDHRPLWRKLLSLSVLPHFPDSVQNRIRGLIHPGRGDMLALLTPLSETARNIHRERARRQGGAAGLDNFSGAVSHQESATMDHAAEDGEAADISLGFEQLYGVRRRDVTAYRPLIEFCLGMPTEQFASGGQERRLARRMAIGRMPEEQRLNRDYGQHNIDWITRIGRDRAAMINACQTMRGHPVLSEILDLDRIIRLLTDWPDQQTFDLDREWPRMFAIPQAILVAQFVGMVEGRNDL